MKEKGAPSVRTTTGTFASGIMGTTETVNETGRLRAASIVACALAIVFAVLLWPSAADAQTRALRPKCEGPERTLNVQPSGGSATFSATEPIYGCVRGSSPTFLVKQTCTFHCQHWHTWVPTGKPMPSNVRLSAAPAAGSFLVGWSNCAPRLGQSRSDCTVRVSGSPTNVAALLSSTPDTTPPAAFALGAPTAESYAATIRWSPSSDANGVAGYDVFRNDVLVARAGGGATSVKVGSLSCESTHAFRVDAFDTAGNFVSSGPIDVTTGRCGVTQKPNTAIHVKPAKTTRQTAAFFHFGAKGTVPATKFQCKLDKGRWTSCSGTKGKRYRGLKKGYHTFRVRAGNANGWDATPASHRWRIR